MKSKLVAYLLLFFFGLLGVHRFYLGKIPTGLLYLFTGALFGLGWIYDLITLASQVDLYNALYMSKINYHFKR
ncbi:MAG: NINE protein [Bacteroides sp.]|nr:NINE protein [Bacteroides sp.]